MIRGNPSLRDRRQIGAASPQSSSVGIPIGNGILTTDTDEQALTRCEQKGAEAAQAAIELANLLEAIDGD